MRLKSSSPFCLLTTGCNIFSERTHPALQRPTVLAVRSHTVHTWPFWGKTTEELGGLSLGSETKCEMFTGSGSVGLFVKRKKTQHRFVFSPLLGFVVVVVTRLFTWDSHSVSFQPPFPPSLPTLWAISCSWSSISCLEFPRTDPWVEREAGCALRVYDFGTDCLIFTTQRVTRCIINSLSPPDERMLA